MLRFLILLVFTGTFSLSQAQSKSVAGAVKYSINGYVKDSLSGESIIGATISVNGQTKGVASNQYGFYSLTLEEGNYEISITHISYQAKSVPLELKDNQQYNFELIPKSAAINEVVVFSKRRDANVKNAQM